MSIIRVKKNKKNPYFIMNKTGINDRRLSFKAKGLFSYLISKPDDWYVNYHDLVKSSINGIKSIRSAVKELLITGYIVRSQLRIKSGRFSYYDYTVYENPQKPKYSRNKLAPYSPKRHAEKPLAENLTLIYNDSKRIISVSSKHSVKKNVDNSVVQEDPSRDELKKHVIQVLYELGIKNHEILFDKYNISDIFIYSDWMLKKISKIKNPTGFLITALKEKWSAPDLIDQIS